MKLSDAIRHDMRHNARVGRKVARGIFAAALILAGGALAPGAEAQTHAERYEAYRAVMDRVEQANGGTRSALSPEMQDSITAAARERAARQDARESGYEYDNCPNADGTNNQGGRCGVK